MDPEKDEEVEMAAHPVGGTHGLRGGSSSKQGSLAEKEAEQQRHASTSSEDLEKGEKKMQDRKSFDDVEGATDAEPYQEVSFLSAKSGSFSSAVFAKISFMVPDSTPCFSWFCFSQSQCSLPPPNFERRL